MAASNAERCIANTLVYEGGFTLHRSDPGNWTGGKVGSGELKGTNFGIAANTYPTLDIKNLTKSQAIAIYKRDWWPRVAGERMPKGVDQIAYDGAVNSGASRGLRWIAEACGIPDERRASVIAATAESQADKTVTVKKACARRMSFLRGLGTFGTFGTGWTRRVAAMEAIGVKMALEATGNVNVPARLETEKKQAEVAAKKNGTAAGGSAAPATIGPAADPSTWDMATWLFVCGGALILLGLVIFFVWKWKIHRERAQAYADVAAGKIGG